MVENALQKGCVAPHCSLADLEEFSMMNRLTKNLLPTLGIFILASCGGGGGSTSSNPPLTNTAPAPTPTPTPTPTAPTVTLATSTLVQDGTSMGAANSSWGTGSTATGGQGQTLDGLSCGDAGANYSYVHLNIYQNGQQLSLPANIGVVAPTVAQQKGCVYPLHTRDTSGKIRIDTSTSMTLGQFFDVWGQPLSASNVAGITDQPVKVYTTDHGQLVEYTGDIRSLPLTPQREITIVAGSSVTQIPTYTWQNPPPLAPNPVVVWDTPTIGVDNWVDGPTATGGQGSPTADGLVCEPTESTIFHSHMHLAFLKDGQQLALPQNIGIVNGCFYDLHTHDKSGVVHTEAPGFKKFTLANLFSVWGMPLSETNVAGLTGAPIKVYINEGGDVWQYHGNPANIELVSHRSVTFQIGTDASQIPAYGWGANLQ
jgi:hypothetical protein